MLRRVFHLAKFYERDTTTACTCGWSFTDTRGVGYARWRAHVRAADTTRYPLVTPRSFLIAETTSLRGSSR
jgi:hypothetical protein